MSTESLKPSFTKGPWEWSQLWIWRPSQIGATEIKPPQIAYVGYGHKRKDDTEMDDEQQANARLIAAAPELFELLRAGLEDGDPMNWDKVSDLLYKITGQE